MVRDPASGKYRRTRLFVLTLGYSRKAVRLLVRRSSAQVLGRRPAVSRPRSSASDDLDDAQTYLDRWERREPRPRPAPPAGT